jgi:hypothetical protein
MTDEMLEKARKNAKDNGYTMLSLGKEILRRKFLLKIILQTSS